MSDYQICAVIDGDDIDLCANREKFRILEQTMRDIKHDPALSCAVRGHQQELAKLEFKIGEFICQS